MSGLRMRVERLAQLAGQPAEEAPVLIVERLGEDDFGGGWRGPWFGEGHTAPVIGVGEKLTTVREVMFGEEAEGAGVC